MQVIVCVDDDMGMLFNHRRQSRDRVLIQRILEIAKGKRIFMNTYSAELFEGNENICIDDDFLKNAGDGDICFVENVALSGYIEKIDKIIVYKWNRRYPADFYMDIPLIKNGWQSVENYDFKGYSHEKITEEVYER
ncbi:MAG: ribonuclease Z [Waltera sp.]